MFKLKIVKNDISLSLDDMFKTEREREKERKNRKEDALELRPNKNYIVTKIDGLTPPTSNISSNYITNTDVQEKSNVRLESRSITIDLYINPPVETNRIRLYNFFKLKDELSLYYSNGTRNLVAYGYVESFECDLFSNREMAQITLKCLDPYLYPPTYKLKKLSFIDQKFKYPFSHADKGKIISTLNKNNDELIMNDGDVDTGCRLILKAKGAITSPIKIYDVENKQAMTLNTGMNKNDKIFIQTNTGVKRIQLKRSGKTSNILKYLSDGSNWIQLHQGKNVLAFTTGDNQTSNLLEIEVMFYEQYLGV